MIYYLFFFFLSCSAIAWTPPSSFSSTYIELEDSIFSATIKGHFRDAESLIAKNVVNDILKDKNHLINKQFHIPKYFDASVRFWFSIYTQYQSSQVVIHDKNNLKIIYNVIDFSELHNNQGIHRFSKSKLQSQLSLEYTRRLKKVLKRMSKKSYRQLNEEEDDILTSLKVAGVKFPKKKRKRSKFFLKLANNIRVQTGQRNKIFKGIIRSIPYMPYLKKKIKLFNLPQELLAIPFLESSFNPVAQSKVKASGIWQFMPFIGNLFMPKTTDAIDYRSNPIIASLAAFHLLKENKLILRRWDLAVTAYNSGTKHLGRAIRKLSKKRRPRKISLDYILNNYKHPHIGFASKNFYSEFLALVHVIAYKDLIYPLQGVKHKSLFKGADNINIYVSKCSLNPKRVFYLLKKSSPNIKALNTHIKQVSAPYSKGTLLVSDTELTKRKYFKVTDKIIQSSFPKFFSKYIKHKKCS